MNDSVEIVKYLPFVLMRLYHVLINLYPLGLNQFPAIVFVWE